MAYLALRLLGPGLGLSLGRACAHLKRPPGRLAPSLSSSSSPMEPRVAFSPAGRSLFDQPLGVSVEALRPEQEVTLRARLQDEAGEVFESRALFRADGEGRVDASRSEALVGGSYSGLEPLGLLWALKPQRGPRRLVKRQVESPFLLEVAVLEGHGGGGGKLLAKGSHERAFLGPGLARSPVREGPLRATLFLPPGESQAPGGRQAGQGRAGAMVAATFQASPEGFKRPLHYTVFLPRLLLFYTFKTFLTYGDGPFPGIIDIYGTGGGLPEYRACLLANYGFVVLALAYYGYEDLPKQMKEFHLEYFEEAVNYMLKHPKVKGPGIGLLGHSKGGDLCISMASFLKGITATVTVNGSIANVGATLHYKDITIPPLGFNPKRAKMDKNGFVDIIDVLDNPLEGQGRQSLIPLEKAEGHFMFIVGKDDHNWKSEFFANEASKILQAHGKEKPEIICYPGAGHYIEPPYTPMCPASMHLLVGRPAIWGGEPRAHAAAQVDAWKQIQVFFHKHLSNEQDERQSKL